MKWEIGATESADVLWKRPNTSYWKHQLPCCSAFNKQHSKSRCMSHRQVQQKIQCHVSFGEPSGAQNAKVEMKKKTGGRGGQKPFEQHCDMRSWDLWCLHVKTSQHTCTTDWKHTGERWQAIGQPAHKDTHGQKYAWLRVREESEEKQKQRCYVKNLL